MGKQKRGTPAEKARRELTLQAIGRNARLERLAQVQFTQLVETLPIDSDLKAALTARAGVLQLAAQRSAFGLWEATEAGNTPDEIAEAQGLEAPPAGWSIDQEARRFAATAAGLEERSRSV